MAPQFGHLPSSRANLSGISSAQVFSACDFSTEISGSGGVKSEEERKRETMGERQREDSSSLLESHHQRKMVEWCACLKFTFNMGKGGNFYL